MGITDNSLIKIEIDGIEFSVKRGSKIIEIADEAGIYIPRFCYHKKLSIAANCRMCLVEVAKTPKLFPACATPVTDGMKVFTNTEKVIEAQRAVMEFLLINHPLDCPICDQGGECELQDLAVGYGCSSSRFLEKKRSFNDYDLGPLVATDVTRCILCSRCVRFCEEIAGTEEIGIINRGSNSRIFTFLKKHLTSEISGNVIDLCPVGALTSKPSRFKFRAWELLQYPFISYHDCVGSNLYVHVFRDQIVRIVPKKNDLINESWISDRDRFSYEGINKDRIEFPMIKLNGKWKNSSWNEALEFIFSKINSIKEKFGSEQIACLSSPNSTTEEFFVLQKFIRSLGSNNIDHRLKQIDFKEQDKFPIFPGLDIDLEDIDKNDLVFLIGCDISKEQPIIALKLRKIINKGGKVFVLNPVDFSFSMNLSGKFILNPKDFLLFLKNIIEKLSLNLKTNKDITFLNSDNKINFENQILVDSFLNSNKKIILLGSYISCSQDYHKILFLSSLISDITNSNFGILTEGSNSSGAWLSGFVPHRHPGGKNINKEQGLDAYNIFSKKLKSYILFNLELEFDSFYSDTAIEALKNSEFVLYFSSFKNQILFDTADVILPITSSYENSGTFINVSGNWQTFNAVIPHGYDVRYGWKAICDIANYFKLSGFSYKNIESILNEFKSFVNLNTYIDWSGIKIIETDTSIKENVNFIISTSIYDTDSLVRRAASLQKTYDKKTDVLKCNSNTYNFLKIENNVIHLLSNNEKKKYFIFVDESIADKVIFVESCNIIDYRGFQISQNISILNKL